MVGLVNGLDWQCCLAGSSKMAPRILIVSIAIGAEYLSYVKFIATEVPTFFEYIVSVLASVRPPWPHFRRPWVCSRRPPLPPFMRDRDSKFQRCCVVLFCHTDQKFRKRKYGQSINSTVESRFKEARFKKESRFKKDCCYNRFFLHKLLDLRKIFYCLMFDLRKKIFQKC